MNSTPPVSTMWTIPIESVEVGDRVAISDESGFEVVEVSGNGYATSLAGRGPTFARPVLTLPARTLVQVYRSDPGVPILAALGKAVDNAYATVSPSALLAAMRAAGLVVTLAEEGDRSADIITPCEREGCRADFDHYHHDKGYIGRCYHKGPHYVQDSPDACHTPSVRATSPAVRIAEGDR